jgi:hypothetical protein
MRNTVKTNCTRIELLKAFARRREKRLILYPKQVTMSQETAVLDGRAHASTRMVD